MPLAPFERPPIQPRLSWRPHQSAPASHHLTPSYDRARVHSQLSEAWPLQWASQQQSLQRFVNVETSSFVNRWSFFCLTLFIAYLSDLTFFLIHFSFSTAWQVSGTSERPHGIHRFIKGQPHALSVPLMAGHLDPHGIARHGRYIAFSLPNTTLDDVYDAKKARHGTRQQTTTVWQLAFH